MKLRTIYETTNRRTRWTSNWSMWDARIDELEKIFSQAAREGRWETVKSAMRKMGFKYDRLPRSWRTALKRRGGWSDETKEYLEQLKRNISLTKDWSEIIDGIENTYREVYKNKTPMKRADILKQNGVDLVNSSGNATPIPQAMRSELIRRGGWAPDVQKIMIELGHRDRYVKPSDTWNMITQNVVDVLQMAAQDNTPISVPDILELVGLKRNTRFPPQVIAAMKLRGGWPPEVSYIKRDKPGRPFIIAKAQDDKERSHTTTQNTPKDNLDYHWGSWEESRYRP